MSFSFSPTQTNTFDPIASFLFKAIKVIIIGLICLLPLLWWQPAFLLLLPIKTFTLALIVALVVIIGSLAILRQAQLNISLYTPIIAWWGVVGAAGVSALLAPDYVNALIGFSMSIHTVAFLGMLGVLMMAMGVFHDSKQWSLLCIMAFVAPILLLTILHGLRLLFGAEFLTLGVLNSVTDTVVGSWNDLGILVVLAISILMVTLVQLPLPNLPRLITVFMIGVLLYLLAIINFSVIWYGLGLFSLSLLLYVLTRDRVTVGHIKPSILAIITMSTVAVVSILFIIAGGSIGGYINNNLGANYVEVRPSFGATLDVTQQVLGQNLIFGVGPNHFDEAWRNYRDPAINETVFWNVDFLAGNGYISTWFASTGLLGVIAWFIFITTFFYSGARVLLMASNNDRFWFYVASISFLVAASVWLISLFYVPGAIVLVYGAVATGLLFASARPLGVAPLFSHLTIANQRTGLIFILATLILVVGSVGFGYIATKQFTATTMYAAAYNVPAGENQFDEVVAQIASAYNLYPRDIYLQEIIELRLTQVYQLLALESPSESEQRLFEEVITSAIEIASEAVRSYPRNPKNWAALGSVYQALATAGVEGAADRALAAYGEAIARAGQNPLYYLRTASVRVAMGDEEGARADITKATELKRNYVDAYVLLSELEILTGNTESALAATRALISLEPRNAGLYYRLGILHLANENLNESISALTDALQFDPQFANARYVRALVYAELGNRPLAITELEIVRNQNEENSVVDDTIALIQDENSNINALTLITPIQESAPVSQQDVVLSGENLDTDLISPVNTPPVTTERVTDQVFSDENEPDTTENLDDSESESEF